MADQQQRACQSFGAEASVAVVCAMATNVPRLALNASGSSTRPRAQSEGYQTGGSTKHGRNRAQSSTERAGKPPLSTPRRRLTAALAMDHAVASTGAGSGAGAGSAVGTTPRTAALASLPMTPRTGMETLFAAVLSNSTCDSPACAQLLLEARSCCIVQERRSMVNMR